MVNFVKYLTFLFLFLSLQAFALEKISTNSNDTLPNMGSSNTTENKTNAINSSQLGFKGPLSFGTTYDELLGYSWHMQLGQSISDNAAIAILGEYGANMYRLGFTTGFKLSSQDMIKLTIERLSEVLPFQFDKQKINERFYQMAYGVRYKRGLTHPLLKEVDAGAYYSKAPGTDLHFMRMDNSGNAYQTSRYIDGSIGKGVDIGTKIKITPKTRLNTHLFYDELLYDNISKSLNNYNAKGLGASVGLNHLLSNAWKVNVNSEFRKIYNNYSMGISWLPQRFAHNGLEVSLVGNKWVFHNAQASNYNIALQAIFSLERRGLALTYCSLPMPGRNTDLTAWTTAPAVHINTVQITPERVVSVGAPVITSIPLVAYREGPMIITINGSNFDPGATVQMDKGSVVGYLNRSANEIKLNISGISNYSTVQFYVVNSDGQVSNTYQLLFS
ncbi:MAG: hypothetical protein LEGION0398_MBIBDBAK_00583 [Legionellaceae bacterium]